MNACFKYLAVLIAFAVVFSAGADEFFLTLEVNGSIYTNVTVTAVSATDIYFTCDGGMGNANLKDLSPNLQEHFHYKPATAASYDGRKVEANAQFLASQPPEWETDLRAALIQAASDNRCVLLEFANSDRPGWCAKLNQEVFSTPQFGAFAQSQLVLVRVDSSHNIRQDDHPTQANSELARRFKVGSYPTCILLDPSGKELGRHNGYAPGGPQAFIDWAESKTPETLKHPTLATTTPSQPAPSPAAPVTSVGQAASFVANVAPKLGRNWYWFVGIAVFLVMLRGIWKELT